MAYKIKVITFILASAGILFPTGALCQQENSPPATVRHVDLDRYRGLWFELAKIPNRFQKQCAGEATAYYSIRRDGKIEVTNRCRTEDGDFDEARGIAKVEDPVSNAKLKVSFVKILGVRLFWGDYWVIGLGDDYEYAIVGTPDRKYGWVLSRTPNVDTGTLQEINETLQQQGYDPADFELTPQ